MGNRRLKEFYLDGFLFQQWMHETLRGFNLPNNLQISFRSGTGINSWRVTMINNLASSLLLIDEKNLDRHAMLGSLTHVAKLTKIRILGGQASSRNDAICSFLDARFLSVQESFGLINTLNCDKDKDSALHFLSLRKNISPRERMEIINKIGSQKLRNSAFSNMISHHAFEVELLEDSDVELKEICVFNLFYGHITTFENGIKIIKNFVAPEQKYDAYIAILKNPNIYMDEEDFKLFSELTAELELLDDKKKEELGEAIINKETEVYNIYAPQPFEIRDFEVY